MCLSFLQWGYQKKAKCLIFHLFLLFLICCFCMQSLKRAFAEILDCCKLIYMCPSCFLPWLFLPTFDYIFVTLNHTHLTTSINYSAVVIFVKYMFCQFCSTDILYVLYKHNYESEVVFFLTKTKQKKTIHHFTAVNQPNCFYKSYMKL